MSQYLDIQISNTLVHDIHVMSCLCVGLNGSLASIYHLQRKRLVLRRAALFRARYLLLCYNWTVTSNHTPPSVGTSALCAAPSDPRPFHGGGAGYCASHLIVCSVLSLLRWKFIRTSVDISWFGKKCGASKQGRRFSQINCHQMIAAGFHNSC